MCESSKVAIANALNLAFPKKCLGHSSFTPPARWPGAELNLCNLFGFKMLFKGFFRAKKQNHGHLFKNLEPQLHSEFSETSFALPHRTWNCCESCSVQIKESYANSIRVDYLKRSILILFFLSLDYNHF